MKNRIELSKAKATYLFFGGIFLIAATTYTLITEPTKFNLIAGFFAIILFGFGTFISLNKLFVTKKIESATESVNMVSNAKSNSNTSLFLISFAKSALIMSCVLAFVYFKNDGLRLELGSWILAVAVFIILASLSGFVKIKDAHST